jgi:hypothetical protein
MLAGRIVGVSDSTLLGAITIHIAYRGVLGFIARFATSSRADILMGSGHGCV